VLISALLEGGTVPLATQGSSSSAHEEHCGGRQSQLVSVAMTMIPFGLAAAASLAIGHSSEVRGMAAPVGRSGGSGDAHVAHHTALHDENNVPSTTSVYPATHAQQSLGVRC
jgi:hypothetical protein